MYDAKTSTRGLRLYEPELDTNNPRRLTLVSELRSALQNGGIQVHVQPQGRLSDGQVVRVEALARWHHPELGDISPDEFIPVAERSGLIGPLTTLVLDSSLAACAQLARDGSRHRHRGQPVHAQPARRRPRRGGGAPAAAARRPGAPADPGGHGGLGHGRPRPRRRAAAPAARPRRAPVGGRLRHRLLLAVLPQAPAGAGGQDRPQLHHAAARGWRGRGHRPGDRRPRPAPGPGGRRRGHRGPGDVGPARVHGLRPRPGLAPEPADAGRRPAPVAGHPRRAGPPRAGGCTPYDAATGVAGTAGSTTSGRPGPAVPAPAADRCSRSPSAPCCWASASCSVSRTVDQPAYLPSPEVSWWVLAVAFAATEVYVVHLRRPAPGPDDLPQRDPARRRPLPRLTARAGRGQARRQPGRDGGPSALPAREGHLQPRRSTSPRRRSPSPCSGP